jgi:predicted metal-dependent hydrolase
MVRENLSFPIDNEDHCVVVKRHAQARRLTLRVDPTRQIRLTVPKRCSEKHMRSFLFNHTDWLQQQLRKAPLTLTLRPGVLFPLRGEQYTIAHDPNMRALARIENNTVFIGGKSEHLSRRLREFLKKEARDDLTQACTRYATALGVYVKRLQLRDQRTRWGSCNHRGVICFSWRLIFAPPYVLDYLCAHEVAHLRVMNHSRRFWKIVEEICPHAQKARQWLKSEGNALHAIQNL